MVYNKFGRKIIIFRRFINISKCEGDVYVMTKHEKMFYGMASLIVALIGTTSCEYLGVTGYLIYIGIFGAIVFFASAILEGGKETDREANKEDVNEINNEDRKKILLMPKFQMKKASKRKIKNDIQQFLGSAECVLCRLFAFC